MIACVDVETNGLEPKGGHLFEVACVITDDDLKEVAHTNGIIKPITPLAWPEFVKSCTPFIQDMHGKNSLFVDVEDHGIRLHEAQEQLVAFVSEHLPLVSSKTPLGGSSVGFDRAWLHEHMPMFEGLFSHRNIDVSTLTELAKRWAPGIYESRPKGLAAHRALADVRESISYLQFYREVFIGGNHV